MAKSQNCSKMIKISNCAKLDGSSQIKVVVTLVNYKEKLINEANFSRSRGSCRTHTKNYLLADNSLLERSMHYQLTVNINKLTSQSSP